MPKDDGKLSKTYRLPPRTIKQLQEIAIMDRRYISATLEVIIEKEWLRRNKKSQKRKV